MGKKTSIPDNLIPQRGSRRLYVSDLSFREAMKKTPAKHDPNYDFRKQSEFKKPYKSPDYHQMEYGLDFPGFSFEWPYIGMGGDFGPGYQEDVDQGLWSANFLCLIDACYCPGETKCFPSGCTYPVVGARIVRGRASVSGTNNICIHADEDESGVIEVELIQRFGPSELTGDKVIYGSHIVSVYECDESECCACGGDEIIAYTSQNMEEGTSQTLTITNKIAGDNCYTWEVSDPAGDDKFYLSSGAGASVILYAPADNDGCDHGGTTVTLKCNNVVMDVVEFGCTTNDYPGTTAFTRTKVTCSAVTNGQTQCDGNVCSGTYCYTCCYDYHDCDGNFLNRVKGSGTNSSWLLPTWCSVNCDPDDSVDIDVRTPAMIANGCCPHEVA